jgi:hypothetical protein
MQTYETVFENKRLEPVKLYMNSGDVLTVVQAGTQVSIAVTDPKEFYARYSKVTFLPYRNGAWIEFVKRPGFEEPDLGSPWVTWFLNSEGFDLEQLWVDGRIYYLPRGIPVRIAIKDLSDPWILADSVELGVAEQRERSKENSDYFVRIPLKNWQMVRTRNDRDVKRIRELRRKLKSE